MKAKKMIFLMMLFYALPLICFASETQTADKATLTLHIKGLRNNNGQVVALVFNEAEGFPEYPDKAMMEPVGAPIEKINVKRGRDKHIATVVIEDIPLGEIAVGFMHDENSNWEMEYGKVLWWHTEVPMEGIGVSVKEKLRSKPKYKDCKFFLTDDTEMTCDTLYLPKFLTFFMRKYKKSNHEKEIQ